VKRIKLLASLLPLALTVVAFGAATNASATVICRVPGYTKECPTQSIYNPSKFEPRANSLTLSANGQSVTCGSSSMAIEGFNNNPGNSKPLQGTATFTAFPCISFPSELAFCGGAHYAGGPYHAALAETGGGKGSLAITEAESNKIRQPRIIFTNCAPYNQECVYGNGSFHLEWNGAELPSAVHWHETLSRISGVGDCPENIQVDAAYYLDAFSGEAFTATTPHLEFLQPGEEPGEPEADCAATMSWSGMPSSTLGISTTTCQKGVGACNQATAKGSPYSTSYSVDKSGNAVTTAANVEFELSQCLFGFVCHYQSNVPMTDHVVEHSNQLVITKAPLALKSGFGCWSTLELNGTFTSTSPVWALSPIP
jgi:hypothetical protein